VAKKHTYAIAIGAAALVISTALHAADLYSSGPKTWDTTTANWGTAPGGPYGAAIWNNATPDNAVFEGSGGTVSVAEPISVADLTFNISGSYTIDGGSLAFAPGGTIANSDNRYWQTITGAISGSPTVHTKDWGAGNEYKGIRFAPGSGTVALGNVVNPNNSGTTDKAGFAMAGSTTGNTVSSITYAGGDRYGTVYKEGTSTWTTGDITTGTLRIESGTLVVNGTVNGLYQGVQFTGGTLAGTVTVNQSVTVPASGNLAPGGTGQAGVMTFGSGLNISATAGGAGKLFLDLDALAAANDRIDVTGTADIGTGVLGFSDFTFADLGGVEAGSYVLIATTGGIVGALDPADRTGSIGGLAGALQINGNNLEWATDTDLDGMPDTFELAHTDPPSSTALDPDGDLENGGAGDGLDNLDEYLYGTDPNVADSDGDSLQDGAEVAGAGARPPTDPAVADTDGDTLSDGVESNTGTYVNAADTGTDPTSVDSDNDGLPDAAETNTGAFVDEDDTGTDPNDPNSDSDNAGDWFEVRGSFTDPTDANDKPALPYPLPPDDGSQPATDKPVKVFILSGQSNMVGFGTREGTGPGTLNTIVKTENKFTNLVEGAGNWISRNDVYYRGVISAKNNNGPLFPGSGASGSVFGPECGFGHVMGYHYDEPVLVIKSSIGNRSLSWDCLPPGSPRFDHTDGYTYAGYGDSPNRWLTGEGPSPFVWYAGKQYDDFFLYEDDMGAPAWAIATEYPDNCQVTHNGVAYISDAAHTSSAATEPGVGADWDTYWDLHSVVNVVDILDNFAAEYPQWAAQGFQIAGFAWFQGHKDGGEQGSGTAGLAATRYETNLVNLIDAMRDYYEDRYPGQVTPDAPFVVATCGFSGGNWTPGSSADTIWNAQMAVGDPAQHSQYAGTVSSVDTTNYWRDASESPTSTGYHYNHNAETYLLVGDALGRAMVDMLGEESPPPGTMTASPTAPTVDGEDIANYAAETGTDKWWASDDTSSGSCKGQTFMTGKGAVRFRGVTYRVSPSHMAEPTKTYVVRVGTVSGSTFTEVHSETFTQDFTWNAGEYMTWAFLDPPLLLGNTVYAVDVGMTGSTSGWQTGIPYVTFTANEYGDGSFYTSGQFGVGDAELHLVGQRDRTFHLDLARPIGPDLEFVAGSPANGATDALVPPELVATFSQDLVIGSGHITVRNLSDATETNVPVSDPRVSVSENLLLIGTDGLVDWEKSYAIRMDPGAVENGSGTGFAGITNDTTWSFTTATGDPLLTAVADLKDHINGVTNLNAAEIEARKLTIDAQKSRFDESTNTVLAVLDLVTTYDGVEGPIWVSGSTAADGFNRGSVVNDLHWTIYTVMQHIMDEIYDAPGALLTYRAELDGYSFGCHVDFPGTVTASVVPGETNSVSINASFPNTFGRDTQGWTVPARKPTGCYLPPGKIATVIVPPALVGQGFKVRVGAHSWDLQHRNPVQRLERCTVLYNIDSTEIEVANPLGGGIYIEVPMLANKGVVTVQVTGAVRSPYFSYKSFHATTSNEWVTVERGLGSPWADFQSDKYMMQVPSMWIYALDDPETLMAEWDATMDAMNDLMGFPHLRGKETMYCQVDVIMRSSVHAPGYPAVNQTDGSPGGDTHGGDAGSYLVRGPGSGAQTEVHEQGHAYFFPKFGGETESNVNLPYVAVLNRVFGRDLGHALAASNGYGGNTNRTLDNVAVTWMTVFNFSPREVPMASGEKAYQMKGHAKFVDIARLFGWDGLGRFWYFYNSNDTYNISYPGDDDSKLVQLCKSVGHDIRPLFHFWGTPPGDPVTVEAAIDAEGLTAPTEIRDLLLYYKSLVPADNAAFQTFAFNWWNKQPSIGGYWTEREHSRQWDEEALFGEGDQQRADITTNEMYIAACATQVRDRVQEIIDLYYSSDTNAPSVTELSPADDTTGVGLGANLVVTFDEAIAAGAGNITIKNLTEASQTVIAVTNGARVSFVNSNLTVNPASNLEAGDNYAVQIDAGAIEDGAGNDFAGIADDTTWSFSTTNAVPTVSFATSAAMGAESNAQVMVTVVLSHAYSATTTVDYVLYGLGTTATITEDFNGSGGTLIFDPGETNESFTFEVINDTADELEETIAFALGAIGNGTAGATTSFTYTIEIDSADWYVLPFSETFEDRTLGDLDDQHGWIAAGAQVQDGTTYGGSEKAGEIAGGGYMRHEFNDAHTRVWTDVRMKVAYREEAPEPPADFTVAVYVSTNGHVMAFDGANAVSTGRTVSENDWVRYTILSDYSAARWTLYINDTPAGQFEFFNTGAVGYSECQVSGGPAFVDDVNVTLSRPPLDRAATVLLLR